MHPRAQKKKREDFTTPQKVSARGLALVLEGNQN
jgi:hypothetical protein